MSRLSTGLSTGLPIALTMGEPAGIGPDITGPAWQALRNKLAFFLIGDANLLPATYPVEVINDPSQAASVMPYAIPVLAREFGAPRLPGRAQSAHAPHIIAAIRDAVTFVNAGQAAALTTNPINKRALQQGGDFPYPGHTEFLAHLAGIEDVVMMLACDALKVVPATIHIPLSEVQSKLTPAKLEAIIRTTHAAMQRDFAQKSPRIAVAGLNPHAGEEGAMGMDEITMITPVLNELRSEGLDISGPLPADTMFHAQARTRYDVAICMYHDQALIPIKTLDFAKGVNVTLGLPFVRTSPDHGTAYDIAGGTSANPASLIEALKLARNMADARSS